MKLNKEIRTMKKNMRIWNNCSAKLKIKTYSLYKISKIKYYLLMIIL